MTGRTAFFLLCCTACWTVALSRTRHRHRRRTDPAQVTLQVATGAGGAAFLLATEEAYRWVDRLTGVANLATLLTGTSIMVSSGALVTTMLLWHFPPQQAHRRIWVTLVGYAAALTAAALLFRAAHVPEERPLDFSARYARDPAVTSFMLVALGTLAYGLGVVATLTWRYALVAHPGWLRRALLCGSTGAWVVLPGFCLTKIIILIMIHIGSTPPTWAENFASVTSGSAALLICAALALPTAELRLKRIRTWGQVWIGCHRLYPLWRAVTTQAPEVVLIAPRRRMLDLLDPRLIRFRRYRRYIEIRDGLLLLRQRSASGHGHYPVARADGHDVDSEIRALLGVRVPRRQPWPQPTAPGATP